MKVRFRCPFTEYEVKRNNLN